MLCRCWSSAIIVWKIQKQLCEISCFQILSSRGRRPQTKTYRWNAHWFITLGPLQLCQNHQRIMWDHFDSKIFPEEDGASELTIETSRRNFARPYFACPLHGGNILNTNNPMKILREFFLFWILNQAQTVQKTYNWNIPMPCWWNQLLCGTTGDTGRCALSLQEISVVQGESIIQAVPQIADIILTYHNSNLVIARRLPSFASPVASYRLIHSFVRLWWEMGSGQRFHVVSVRVHSLTYANIVRRLIRRAVIWSRYMSTWAYARSHSIPIPAYLVPSIGPVLLLQQFSPAAHSCTSCVVYVLQYKVPTCTFVRSVRWQDPF